MFGENAKLEDRLAGCVQSLKRQDARLSDKKAAAIAGRLRPIITSLLAERFFRGSAGEHDLGQLGRALSEIIEKPVRQIMPVSVSRGLLSKNGDDFGGPCGDETLWKTKLYKVYEKHELWLWPRASSPDAMHCGYHGLRRLFLKETENAAWPRLENILYETADALVWSVDFYLAFALVKNHKCREAFGRLIELFPMAVPVRERRLDSGEWYILVP